MRVVAFHMIKIISKDFEMCYNTKENRMTDLIYNDWIG